ncbi:hypothetical protein AciX8_2813 [Granulicella mallensis MP5ACTX8]|uniref:Uncharacterized protein n=1 Tax=Granulicella mallensis (strain ATCC BAA-1857 / DSM 23137 / MP5ACTX8) TaxID=682795 RepID=G8NP16_GRAMM|nr:hypothetical protein AciX8_2813 [Granulicella mallensis MP5ACTX8]
MMAFSQGASTRLRPLQLRPIEPGSSHCNSPRSGSQSLLLLKFVQTMTQDVPPPHQGVLRSEQALTFLSVKKRRKSLSQASELSAFSCQEGCTALNLTLQDLISRPCLYIHTF